MKKALGLLISSTIIISPVWADGMTEERNESAASVEETSLHRKLANYSGIIGTAPKSQTITAAGSAFEASPNATNFYVFFTQTLSNDIYYEVRLVGRYNYASTSNPSIPGIPQSDINPPMGYATNLFLGYNFHPAENVNVTPYLRINLGTNIGPVYDDSNGDYLNSQTYAILPGVKVSFKASPVLSPYINIWGGFQSNSLTGAYPNSETQSTQPITGMLNQVPITYQFGVGMKLTPHVTMIPYTQYTVTFNYPDSAALTSINEGGLNQSSLTGASYAYGLKLSIAW